MDIERAKEICAAINKGAMIVMGFGGEIPKWLDDVSLAEMVEAAHMVEAMGVETQPDGSKIVTMYPDDRLVAAVYTLLNFEADDPDDGVEPIVHDGRNAALAVFRVLAQVEEAA